MKEKKVLISQKLFLDIYTYFELDIHDNEDEIRRGLNDKLDAMVMHDTYTQYKTAPTDEEREMARQQYLDEKGIRKDFRW